MKKYNIASLLILLLLLLVGQDCVAQEQSKPISASKKARIERQNEITANLSRIIGGGKYRFFASKMMPTSVVNNISNIGGAVYGMSIKPDSISVFLPFYGASYAPDLQSTSIDFISTRFDYKVMPKRKGGWQVKIDTKDRDTAVQYQLSLNITESGLATLTVLQSHREVQTFQGSVGPIPPKP